MTPQEKEIRQCLKDDFEHYAKKCLKIRSKSGEVHPFILNKAQLHIHELIEDQKARTGKIRCIILKGRQQGCSTLVEGRFYWRVSHSFGTQAFILTHALDATNNLYKMVQRYHEHCPKLVKPAAATSNSKELIFGALDSGYKIGTAENKAVGRSQTIQLFHGSEVAFWSNAAEHAKGILQAVPGQAGTEVFLESTANGIGNFFHEQWQLAEAGLSEYIAIFVPWFWQDEYQRPLPIDFDLSDEESDLVLHFNLSYEQIYWRRIKITELSVGGTDGVKAFKQEYPCTSQEAFQSSSEDIFITPDIAITAAKMPDIEKYGPLIVGVDPARFGDDRTAIIRREGRVIYGKQTFTKHDTMQIAGICHNIILTEEPKKMFIDVCGLGAGIFDRLKELGHEDIIVAVNSGMSPNNAEKYTNKRGEMAGEFREWLLDLPCSIPDDSELLSDICGVQYKFDSKGRMVLERKEDMKKRGVRSPDTFDACCLLFAYPESAYQLTRATSVKKAQTITKSFRAAQVLRKKIAANR